MNSKNLQKWVQYKLVAGLAKKKKKKDWEIMLGSGGKNEVEKDKHGDS